MKYKHITTDQAEETIPKLPKTDDFKTLVSGIAEERLGIPAEEFAELAEKFSCYLPADFGDAKKYSQEESCVILINTVADVLNEIDARHICF
jgi:hypothetical protein